MSSDGYFDDEFNSAMLEEMDNIEAAHFSPPKSTKPLTPLPGPPPLAKEKDDYDFFDSSFYVDESELQRLDNFIEDAYKGKAQPVAGPSKVARTNSGSRVQMTLFGDVLPQEDGTSEIRSGGASSRSRNLSKTKSNPRNPFGQQARKTKVWDQTAFAKSGWKKPKSKGKGKAKDSFDHGEDEEAEEEVEFEQFPAPFVSVGPPLPMKLSPDLLEAKSWIYPLNQPKRDYQFNIVKRCLFDNTLVALPTGLGKTFIAGVVMLNYYRWFPKGKIVFAAPTKPLVAQQIDACHRTCGIPGRDAIELTGQNPRAMRARAWLEKRLFFMTPQTFINDLRTENCDSRDIVLIVIDEAHKATGDYAYAQVIRYLMAKNPHFRVLALTATPGSTPEAVQAIVDTLHISRIEIRDEESLDLKEYMHKKTIKQHILRMSDDIIKVRDLLAKVMETTVKPLKNRGIFPGHTDVINMHSYRPQAIIKDIMGGDPSRKGQIWAIAPLKALSALSRAMGYLLEGTMGMCHTSLQELNAEPEPQPGKKPAQNKMRSDPNFQAVIREIEAQRLRGFSPHPKMELLKALVLQHFADSPEQDESPDKDDDGPAGTRAIVFVTFREAVDEIVEELNRERPLIKASKFVGQGTDKQGKKGFAQREQIEVIKKFTDGEFNVLVATAIGEEGLDIGDVDLIMCYDAQKTPIRMLQRAGRTGRKRAGFVHVLLAESREENNWAKAQATYSDVQRTIVRGEQLELYSDVERLLPDDVRPGCHEMVMDIEPYVREDVKKRNASRGDGSPTTKEKKRKRNDDIGRNIPVGASTGFVSVAELLVKGSKKRKTSKKFNPAAGEDDETDAELEAGVFAPRRTTSVSAIGRSPKDKKKLRRATTEGGNKVKKTKGTQKKKATSKLKEPVAPTSSQFSKKGADDSDDMEIERGIVDSISTSLDVPAARLTSLPVCSRPGSPDYWSSSPDIPPPNEVTDLALGLPKVSVPFDVDASPVSSRKFDIALPRESPPKNTGSSNSDNQDHKSSNYCTLSDPLANQDVLDLASDSPRPSLEPNLDSSPVQLLEYDSVQQNGGSSKSSEASVFCNNLSLSISPNSTSGTGGRSMAWLVDDDDEPDIEIIDSSPLSKRRRSPAQRVRVESPDVEIIEDIRGSLTGPHNFSNARPVSPDNESVDILEVRMIPTSPSTRIPTPDATSTLLPSSSSPKRRSHLRNIDMLPPEIPAHRPVSPVPSDHDYPDSSLPVRPLGKQLKKRSVVLSSMGSPHVDAPPPSQRRLQKRSESSPALCPPPVKQRNRNGKHRKNNPWIDSEAVHSGDEISAGSSQCDETESESDRLFMQGLPETQVSPSYDQNMAYRQSLLSQPPSRGRVPFFANRPVRSGRFGIGGARPRLVVSSSPPNDDIPDEYALGSFVVDDEEEMVYTANSSF